MHKRQLYFFYFCYFFGLCHFRMEIAGGSSNSVACVAVSQHGIFVQVRTLSNWSRTPRRGPNTSSMSVAERARRGIAKQVVFFLAWVGRTAHGIVPQKKPFVQKRKKRQVASYSSLLKKQVRVCTIPPHNNLRILSYFVPTRLILV